MCEGNKGARRASGRYRWTVWILRANERSTVQRTHVAEIEVLVNRTCPGVYLQIISNPLGRQSKTAFFQAWHSLVVFGRRFLQTKLLGEEEKRLIFPGI